MGSDQGMHSFQGAFHHLYKKVTKQKGAMLDCSKTPKSDSRITEAALQQDV